MNDETLQALAERLRRTVRGEFLDLCDGVLRLLSEKRVAPVKIKSDGGCPACAARRAADTERVRKHRERKRA